MADSEAYRVKQDISIPRALREVETMAGGEKVFENEGRTYGEGDYVLAKDITPPVRERVENGELDNFLEPASLEEAQAHAHGLEYSTYAPEHSAEREAMMEYGHTVIERGEQLENNARDAEYHAEAQKEAKEDGADERPNLTHPEVPALNEGEVIVPKAKRSRPGSSAEDPGSTTEESSSSGEGAAAPPAPGEGVASKSRERRPK